MNRRIDVVLATVAVVIICLVMAFTSGCDKKPALEVGQVWKTTWDSNPFKTTVIVHEVIALDGRYVQYRDVGTNGDGQYINSMSKAGFLIGAKLIKKNAAERPKTETPESEQVEVDESLVTMPPMPPIWGQGDLPSQWVEYFGTDNGARVDYVQSQIINEIAKRLRVLEMNQYVPDPNGVK